LQLLDALRLDAAQLRRGAAQRLTDTFCQAQAGLGARITFREMVAALAPLAAEERSAAGPSDRPQRGFVELAVARMQKHLQ